MKPIQAAAADAEKKLMGKQVTINRYGLPGVVRGYAPASAKWWVVTSDLLTTKWYTENELTVEGE